MPRRPMIESDPAGCDYTVEDVNASFVLLRDNNTPGTLSLTNSAERICMQMHERYPGRRLFYYDTDGHLDEMRHTSGRFDDFAPASENQLRVILREAAK